MHLIYSLILSVTPGLPDKSIDFSPRD